MLEKGWGWVGEEGGAYFYNFCGLVDGVKDEGGCKTHPLDREEDLQSFFFTTQSLSREVLPLLFFFLFFHSIFVCQDTVRSFDPCSKDSPDWNFGVVLAVVVYT